MPDAKTAYVVCGSATVAGKKLGDTLTTDDLATANIAALIQGGHIKSTKTNKPAAGETKE